MGRVILRVEIRVLMMLQRERQNQFLKKNPKLKSLKGEIETSSAGSVKVQVILARSVIIREL